MYPYYVSIHILVLLTYIHDVLNHIHNHKPVCSGHRYVSQPTYIFTFKISRLRIVHNTSPVILKGIITCLLLWQHNIFAHLPFLANYISISRGKGVHSPSSYYLGQKFHDSSEWSQPCIHSIHLFWTIEIFSLYFTHQGNHIISIAIILHHTCASLERSI